MTQAIYYYQSNVVCILIAVILFFCLHTHYRRSMRVDLFRWMLIWILVFCVSDILAITFRGQTFPGATALIWISNILYTMSLGMIAFFWMNFSIALLRGRVYRGVLIGTIIWTSAMILLNVLTPITGWVFTVNAENLYVRGPLVWLNWVYLIPCFLAPILATIWSKASRRVKVAVILYPVAPVVASILQGLFYGVSVGQAGATISALLIYVMIQGFEMNDQKLKAQIYDELANTDSLTGLSNRRAYEARLASSELKDWIGVVFFDINGLKTTNDEQGHLAGDGLIRSVTEFLKRFFPRQDLYRISGDEFVAFTEDKATFESKLAEIKRSNPGFVACGHGDGSGKDSVEVVRKAETEMYKDKAEYYIKSGKNRRR